MEVCTLVLLQKEVDIIDDEIQVKEGDVIGLFSYVNATKQVIGFREVSYREIFCHEFCTCMFNKEPCKCRCSDLYTMFNPGAAFKSKAPGDSQGSPNHTTTTTTLCLGSIIKVVVINKDGSSRIIRTDDTREKMEIDDIYEGIADNSKKRFGLNALISKCTYTNGETSLAKRGKD